MKLLRLPEVVALTGLSRMTLWRLERAGRFPARRRLGANSVAWLDSDVESWMIDRPAVQGPAPAGRSMSPLSH
jgi:prophage regulatory protein